MELREALGQIAQIRGQIVQVQTFRGYRSATIGVSGLLAFAAALVQTVLVPRPLENIDGYLLVWVSVALISMTLVGTELFFRARASGSEWVSLTTTTAIEQFSPCLAAGGVITLAIACHDPAALWLLPGVWATLFGLGILASRRMLPPAMAWVGTFYLLGGAVCLAVGPAAALGPWMMGCTFGPGQLAAAAILYWTLESSDAARE
jgi:hypothetical protein